MELSSTNVNDIFMKCLFDEGENRETFIEARGIMLHVGFHPGRIKENEQNIIDMLNDLPDNFRRTKGGGWSFLNMCEDKHAKQWTSFHRSMDQLICLGIAIKKMEFMSPRQNWNELPGAMPYVIYNDTAPVKQELVNPIQKFPKGATT